MKKKKKDGDGEWSDKGKIRCLSTEEEEASGRKGMESEMGRKVVVTMRGARQEEEQEMGSGSSIQSV